jgi:hypothetical protein
MNRKRELSSLYNLLFSKDKEIDFLKRKEEFLKNINLYKKFRQKLFQNIMNKSNIPSKDILKYIFLLWKAKSNSNSEISLKRNCDYSLQKFVLNVLGQKVDKKLNFNNEINFSLSQIIRKLVPTIIDSNFNFCLISQKLLFYRFSITLTSIYNMKLHNWKFEVFIKIKENSAQKIRKDDIINIERIRNIMNFLNFKLNIMKLNAFNCIYNSSQLFTIKKNKDLFRKIIVFNKMKLLLLLRNKLVLSSNFSKLKKILILVNKETHVMLPIKESSNEAFKSNELLFLTLNILEKGFLKLKYYFINNLKISIKKEKELLIRQIHLRTNFYNFSILSIGKSESSSLEVKLKPIIEISHQETVDLIINKKISPLIMFEKENIFALNYEGKINHSKTHNLLRSIQSLYKCAMLRTFLKLNKYNKKNEKNTNVHFNKLSSFCHYYNEKTKITKINAFIKILSFSYIKTIQNSIMLSRQIILSAKLNCLLIIKQKAFKFAFLKFRKNISINKAVSSLTNVYYNNVNSNLLFLEKIINKIKFTNSLYSFTKLKELNEYQSKDEICNFFSKRLFLSKFIINKSTNQRTDDLNSLFSKWKMNSILDKNKEISNKIMMFEEEFLEKINSLEKSYSVNIVKITQQKSELEKKLKLKEDQINEINEEFQTLKQSYQAKSTALDELTNMVESSRTNLTTYDNNIKIIIDENMRLNTIVNQISTKADDYDTLKSENETLREKINEFDKNFKLFEKKKEENNSKLLKELEKKYRELEKNYNNIKEQNENLKSLIFILDSNSRRKLERSIIQKDCTPKLQKN